MADAVSYLDDDDRTWAGARGETVAAYSIRLAGRVAINDAEFYAAGGRRLVIRHGPDDLLPEVRDTILDAASQAGYVGGGGASTVGPANARRTTWSFPGGCSRRPGVDPAAIVAAAAEVARRLDPGTWTIEADEDIP